VAKRKAAHPRCRGISVKGDTQIETSHPKAQNPKGKRHPVHFTTQVAKALKAAADAGYPIKIELGTPTIEPTVNSYEEWKRSRAG
jgi:hypothetical protein